jgi:hypothetical protein
MSWQFLLQDDIMGFRYVLQLLFCEKSHSVHKSTTAEVKE